MAKIGIDFGLANTRVAICQNNKIKIIKDEKNRSSIPSMINFTRKKVYIGHEAETLKGSSRMDEVRGVKNRLGTKDSLYILNAQEISPEIMCAFLLKNAIKLAEKELQETVTEAVISISSDFSNVQKKELMNACKIAGLEKVSLINDSIAVALAYHLVYPKDHAKYLVLDVSKDAMKLSVVEASDAGYEKCAYQKMNGFGGDSVTKIIKDHIVEELKYGHKIVLPMDYLSQQTNEEFFEYAENIKKLLSEEKNTEYAVCYKGKEYTVSCSNQDVRNAATNTLIGMLREIDTFFEKNHLCMEDIEHVILVGGATKNPVIRNFLQQIYHEKMEIKADPEEITAIGAAVYGNLQNDHKIEPTRDSYSNNIGVYLDGKEYHTIVKKDTSFPCELNYHFSVDPGKKSKLSIQIFKGQEKVILNNKLLYRWDIDIPENADAGIDLNFTVNIDEQENLFIDMECCQTNRTYRFKMDGYRSRDIEKEKYLMKFLERYGKKGVKDYVKDAMLIAGCLPYHEAQILRDAARAFEFRMENEKGLQKIKAWEVFYMILLKYMDVNMKTVEYDAKDFFESDFE